MPLTAGFPPVAGPGAKVLVLGTLPGQVSLAKCEYYGQTQNVFWKIMGELFGFDRELPYEERKLRLITTGVALWDVCEAAHRPGSLDASIDVASMRANNFQAFLAAYPGIRLICFNGAKAAELFRRKVIPGLDAAVLPMMVSLPSTSPANAAVPYRAKYEAWSIVKKECEAHD